MHEGQARLQEGCGGEVTTDTDLRDVSLAQAAKLLHRSPATLRAAWDRIPSAVVTEGGRYFVSIGGLREWLAQRGKKAAQ